MSDPDVLGPIDFLLLEFPTDNLRGEVAAEVLALVEAGTVTLWDVLIVQKDSDGTVTTIALDDVTDGDSPFASIAGARSGLLGDDDIAAAAEAMAPGTLAALLVFENAWARPFIAATYRAGGEVIASARIPAQDVNDALDALEAAEAAG